MSVVRQWGVEWVLNFSRYSRLVIWYSCGAASAVACKLAIDQARASGIPFVVAYCDTGSEHPDNARFMTACSEWFGCGIKVLRSPDYASTWEVFERQRWLAGIKGARCTTELKKAVRERYERDGDLQVFGFDTTETVRAERFAANQPEVALWCPLIDASLSKAQCFGLLAEAGIALPTMYLLGYRNNNCIGCVKGNAGYWNKIRRDFPDVFDRMAKLERELGARLCQATIDGERVRVFLDELPLDAGRYSDEPPMACGILCDQPDPQMPLFVDAA